MVLLLFAFQWDPLSIGAGADTPGRGGVYSGGIGGVYYNPGGTGLMESMEIMGMHTELDFGTSYNFFCVVIPFKGLNAGFYFSQIGTGDIPVTEAGDTMPGADYPEVVYMGTASFRASAYSITLSRRWRDKGFGLNFKFLEMKMYSYYGSGFSMDAGFFYRKQRMFLGVSIKDGLNTGMKWNTGLKETILPEFRYDSGYRILENVGVFNNGVLISGGISRIYRVHFDFDRFLNLDKPIYHAGIEVNPDGVLSMRAGVESASDDIRGRWNVCFGLGVRSEHLYINYAFTTKQEIRGNHNISMGYRW